jgi:hypothetical protein
MSAEENKQQGSEGPHPVHPKPDKRFRLVRHDPPTMETEHTVDEQKEELRRSEHKGEQKEKSKGELQ